MSATWSPSDPGSRRLRLLVVVGIVLVAGCGGPGGSAQPSDAATATGETVTGAPTATATPASTPTAPSTTTTAPTTTTATAPTTTTPSTTTLAVRTPTGQPPEIPVENGSVPVDHERIWVEMEQMVGWTDDPPERLVVFDPPPGENSGVRGEFRQYLLDAPPPTWNATVSLRDGIPVLRNRSPSWYTFLLAHEYYHKLQFPRSANLHGSGVLDDPETFDERMVSGSVFEGSAEYAATAYMRRYTDYSESRIRELAVRYDDPDRTSADRLGLAPYHFGQQYVAAVSDSPRDHWNVYRNPPQTTEEVLHVLPPGSEPPRSLTVTAATGEWGVADRDTMGEMFLRIALRTELDAERARTAAAGWGNDRLVTLRRGNATAHVWTLRWDDAANATEFEAAFEAYLDGRATVEEGVWIPDPDRNVAAPGAFDLRRVDDDTVAVLLGPESFVRRASVDGSDGNVTVSSPSPPLIGSPHQIPAVRENSAT